MSMRSLVNFSTRTITVFLVLIALGLFGLGWVFEQVDASSAVDASLVPNAMMTESDIVPSDGPLTPIGFAKYDGFDGESKDENHDKWIDVLSIDWGAHQPTAGAAGMSRRRAQAEVDDLVITFQYEKAAPKLAEKCLKGEVIPKLEIELVATYGGARATYLRYELKNVMITSYNVSGSSEEAPPTVTIGNNFEEIKVTYTEYDDEGSSKGNVEFEYKVEKGS
jgi:type VI secretion system secreted protein Hcp